MTAGDYKKLIEYLEKYKAVLNKDFNWKQKDIEDFIAKLKSELNSPERVQGLP